MKKITFLFMFMVSLTYSQNYFVDHLIGASTAPDPLAAKFADIDMDGDLDFAAVYYNSPANSNGSLYWYENDGNQNYVAHLIGAGIDRATYLTLKSVSGAAAIVVNAGDSVRLYSSSDGGLTWDNSNNPPANVSYYNAIANISGDSAKDMVSVSEDGIIVYERNGFPYVVDNNPMYSVEIGDIDNNGFNDLVTTSAAGDVLWFQNDGTGGGAAFTQHTVIAGLNAYSAYVTDFNGDGNMDVIVSGTYTNKVSWMEGDGTGAFTEHVVVTGFTQALFAKAADIDGDSFLDIVVSSYNSSRFSWFKNAGDNITFTEVTTNVTGYDFDLADMEGDGDIDILLTTPVSDQVRWLENIEEVTTLAALRAKTIGQTYRFTGTGYATAARLGSGTSVRVFGQDATAGMQFYAAEMATTGQTNIALGDGVTNVVGTLTQAYGSLVFVVQEAVTLNGNMLQTPQTITANELVTNPNDYESELIKIIEVTINPGTDTNFVQQADYDMTDSSGTVKLGAIFPQLNGVIPLGYANVTGIASNPNSTPVILPRGDVDVESLSPDNITCNTATVVTCGDNLTGETTDYAFDNGDDLGGCGLGKGVWYKYVGNDNTVTFDITTSGYDIEVALGTTTDCTTFTNISCTDTAYSTGTETITFDADTGTDYFVYVAHYGDTSTTTGNFDLAVSCVPYPDCPDVMNIAATNFVAPGNADLAWDVTTGAAGYNWEIQPQGTAQGDAAIVESGSVTTNSANATTLVSGTDYTLYVQSDCGSGMLGNWMSYDFTFILPPANDDCSTATVVACGASLSGESTVGATDNGDDLGGCGLGKGVWYKYVGNDNTVTFDITTSGYDIEVALGTTTDCTTFTNISCTDAAFSTGTETITFDADAGTDYFVYVAHYSDTSTTTGNFDLDVSCVPYPSCPDVMNIVATNFTAPSNADLTWDVATGAAGYNWEIQPQGTAQGDAAIVESGSVTTNSANATTLVSGTDYTLYVQSDCGSGMLGNWMSYNFTFILPPANDDCLGAELLLEQENMTDYAATTPFAGTISGATDSGLAATTCDGWTGTANDDVWFKFVATTSVVHITLEDDFDGVMNLFDGDCTTLNLLDCADNGTNPQIDATSLTVGDTYYLRVYNYNSPVTSTPNFNISVWSESTASASDLSTVGFEYYPNPVNDKLTVKANENITNIAIFNMLGQQVKQVYPSSLNTQIDMSNLANGTYFIKATIGEKTGAFKIIKK